MFGLEKEEKKKKFDFDLEEEIKKDPNRGKDLLQKAEKRIEELKKKLREGTQEEEYEQLGILLHAYSALKRVLKRMLRRS